jgi:hypothetical protein
LIAAAIGGVADSAPAQNQLHRAVVGPLGGSHGMSQRELRGDSGVLCRRRLRLEIEATDEAS